MVHEEVRQQLAVVTSFLLPWVLGIKLRLFTWLDSRFFYPQVVLPILNCMSFSLFDWWNFFYLHIIKCVYLFSLLKSFYFLSDNCSFSSPILSRPLPTFCLPQTIPVSLKKRADLTGISTEHGIRNYNKTIPKPIYGKASHSEERSTKNRQKNHGYSPLPVLGFPQE